MERKPFFLVYEQSSRCFVAEILHNIVSVGSCVSLFVVSVLCVFSVWPVLYWHLRLHQRRRHLWRLRV